MRNTLDYEEIYENSFKKNCPYSTKLINNQVSFSNALDELEMNTSMLGMKYYSHDGLPVMFELNELNHFIIDSNGFVLWHSPTSHFEKIGSEDSIEVFLTENEFFWDMDDNHIRVKMPTIL